MTSGHQAGDTKVKSEDAKRMDVSAPPNNGDADVQKYTGPSPAPDERHYLCQCYGTATQANSTYLHGVYALCRTDRYPTDAEAKQMVAGEMGRFWPYDNTTTSVDWQFAIDSSGDNRVRASEGANYMRVVAEWWVPDSTGMGYTELNEGKDVKFTGVKKDSCSRGVAELTLATRAAGATLPLIEPSCVDGDWLFYDRIPVGIMALGVGHTLAFRGHPLRARVLAVAAENVAWQRGWDRPIVVRRPAGEPVVAGPTFRFPNTPENAIAFHQPSDAHSPTRCTKIVTSECREHPDLVGLHPDQDVNVQVNYSFLDFVKMTGWYSLWVKVVV